MNDEPIKTPIPLHYTEDDNYVDSLVDRCTERAITQAAMHRTNGKRRTIAVVSTAAAIALVATVAVRMLHKPSLPVTNQDSTELIAQNPAENSAISPMDELLNTLSDDELVLIDVPVPDEIPEY